MAWSDTFLKVLKDNDVRLVASDNYFRSVCTARGDAAVGIVSDAWMAGMNLDIGLYRIIGNRRCDGGHRRGCARRRHSKPNAL